jgi:site-specific DNA recombinase
MMDEFFNAIYEKVIRLDKNYLLKIEADNKDVEEYKEMLGKKQRELRKHEQAFNKLLEMYEEDTITKNVFMERKEVREKQIAAAKNEIKELEGKILEKSSVKTPESIQHKIDIFKHKWTKAINFSEKNVFLKELVEKIMYNRDGNTISLEINYK